MCGRYASTRSSADLSALFEALDQTGGGLAPRWNLAPTQSAPVVHVSPDAGARALSLARWGFLPRWAKDPRAGTRMINARAETVATSRAFASAFASRRALVPVDGWFEWRRHPDGGAGNGTRGTGGKGTGKQAYFFTPRDGGGLALAGLWSRWGPDQLLTFGIVTIEAVGPLAAVHDRMPLVLPPAVWQQWLADDSPAELLHPPGADLVDTLEVRPVGPAVGNVRNDGPELVAPAEPATEPLW